MICLAAKIMLNEDVEEDRDVTELMISYLYHGVLIYYVSKFIYLNNC